MISASIFSCNACCKFCSVSVLTSDIAKINSPVDATMIICCINFVTNHQTPSSFRSRQKASNHTRLEALTIGSLFPSLAYCATTFTLSGQSIQTSRISHASSRIIVFSVITHPSDKTTFPLKSTTQRAKIIPGAKSAIFVTFFTFATSLYLFEFVMLSQRSPYTIEKQATACLFATINCKNSRRLGNHRLSVRRPIALRPYLSLSLPNIQLFL